MEIQDIIYYFLTKDLRTSMWQYSSIEQGSNAHCSLISLCDDFDQQQWDKENEVFRKNFQIDPSERIIYHRDNTFFSDDHNQGLVITDYSVYFIPDNDDPDEKYFFSWVLVDNVEFDGTNMVFSFTDGDSFSIPTKYFTKNGDKYEIGHYLASLFSSMANFIKKESTIKNLKPKLVTLSQLLNALIIKNSAK